uniref:Uncharacterized protein n=1 Tax=Anguilla anguilla TaxID=7936 RepID=A0A0E9WXV4_ANGAN
MTQIRNAKDASLCNAVLVSHMSEKLIKLSVTPQYKLIEVCRTTLHFILIYLIISYVGK